MSNRYTFDNDGDSEIDYKPIPIDGFEGFDDSKGDAAALDINKGDARSRNTARPQDAPPSRPRPTTRPWVPPPSQARAAPLARRRARGAPEDNRLSTKIANSSPAQLERLLRCVRPNDVTASATRNKKMLLKLLSRPASRAKIEECMAGDDGDHFIDHASASQLKRMLQMLRLVRTGSMAEMRERLRVQARTKRFKKVLETVRDGDYARVNSFDDHVSERIIDAFMKEATMRQVEGMMKLLHLNIKLDPRRNSDTLRKWVMKSPANLKKLVSNAKKVGIDLVTRKMDRKAIMRSGEITHREHLLRHAQYFGIPQNTPLKEMEARVKEQLETEDPYGAKEFMSIMEQSDNGRRLGRTGYKSKTKDEYRYRGNSSDSDDDYEYLHDNYRTNRGRVDRIISRDRDRTLRLNEARKLMESRKNTNEKAVTQENAARTAAQRRAQAKLKDKISTEAKLAAVGFDMERASMFLLACDTLVEAALK